MSNDYNTPKVFSVTDINSIARELLENTMLPMWVSGEVGTLTVARSGHVYMTLKDTKSQVRAVWFGGAKMLNAFGVQAGDAVEVFGQLSLYVPGGEFQFKVQSMRPVGLGDLQKRFEEIKQTLLAEGLFETSRKKKLPSLPHRIGVITSPDGAALHDFVNVITRRFPPIHLQIFPAQVQGKNAHLSIIQGLRFFERLPQDQRVDVVVLTRGGGSMEDLWCFNEESLAREIAEMSIPVVSAVGHEIDYTIVDFVSDLRAPTPSAAAELIVPEYQDLVDEIKDCENNMGVRFKLALQNSQNILHQQIARLEKFRPEAILKEYAQRIDTAELKIQNAMSQILADYQYQIDAIEQDLHRIKDKEFTEIQTRFKFLEQRLQSVNPYNVLSRGYAMIKKTETDEVVSSVQKLKKGDAVTAQFADGNIQLQVSE